MRRRNRKRMRMRRRTKNERERSAANQPQRPEIEPEPVVYDMLDSDTDLPLGGLDLKDHMSAIEIGLIRKALEEADGTVAGAARLLRIRRTTLVEKLRKYRLSA